MVLKLPAENFVLKRQIPVVSAQLVTFRSAMTAKIRAPTAQMANPAQQTARTHNLCVNLSIAAAPTGAMTPSSANVNLAKSGHGSPPLSPLSEAYPLEEAARAPTGSAGTDSEQFERSDLMQTRQQQKARSHSSTSPPPKPSRKKTPGQRPSSLCTPRTTRK